MKILVTGGAGFIGSHVAEAYLAAGHEVAIVDDLSRGRRENVPAAARFYQGDICDRDFLEQVFNAGVGAFDCEVFSQVRQALGPDGIEPHYPPRRPGEVERIVLDIGRAR
jgi:nucleoside-diphosphate-sugar epimerase